MGVDGRTSTRASCATTPSTYRSSRARARPRTTTAMARQCTTAQVRRRRRRANFVAGHPGRDSQHHQRRLHRCRTPAPAPERADQHGQRQALEPARCQPPRPPRHLRSHLPRDGGHHRGHGWLWLSISRADECWPSRKAGFKRYRREEEEQYQRAWPREEPQ